MSDIGDKCTCEGCTGVFEVFHKMEGEMSCSCHINPPCSYCVDTGLVCTICGYEEDDDLLDFIAPDSAYICPRNSIPAFKRTIKDLEHGKFDYITFAGAYYFMVYKGYCPLHWKMEDLLAKFNTCFGYTDFYMKGGYFEIKVYTD